MSGVNTLKERTENLKIAKTIKLFIGGEFPRTESGRSAPVYLHKTKKLYANVCVASRKDLRNAVTAAHGAQKGWQSKSAYNRSQILYRMAEMLEAKREEFTEALTATLGLTPVQANKSVDASIEALVYYSGFADKYQQVLGAVNPVSGPHHNFTSTEAVGVVGLIANEKFDLAAFVAQMAAIIVSGNTVVALMSENGSALLAPLAETLATSDLSKGVVNLLTGSTEELYKQFGLHMEIQSLSVQLSDAKKLGELKVLAADNMKRVVNPTKDSVSLEHLMSFVEFKTVWHPIGY
ncbi:MAG: aldehyde dehydrogenase [Pseudobdellovibrio sp.]|jgi:acyl-CoA reductase-like NAD-dependent aldehyde dehydrogenase|nr:aldehyde dehydrogenase [Pseudobdellovibrio sp.]